MRILVIAVFAAIVASMGSALYFLFNDRSGSRRMVKALAVRVGLSIALFLFLMAGYYFGWITGKL
jgi:drug/metabolite transporter (DMT)-like permease